MSLEWIRAHCLSLPHVTEHVQWGNDLVFKVAGKMFAIAVLEPSTVCLLFKVSPEEFAELVERPGIIPAPYMARAMWVGLETPEALARLELLRMITQSYRLIFEKLPRRTQAELSKTGKPKSAKKNTEKKPAAKKKSARRGNAAR